MTSYRFACGEDVVLKAGHTSRMSGKPIFTITGLLPFEGVIPRYSMKAADERFSRVVLEDDIRVPPLTEPAAAAMPPTGGQLKRPSAARTAAEAIFTRRAS